MSAKRPPESREYEHAVGEAQSNPCAAKKRRVVAGERMPDLVAAEDDSVAKVLEQASQLTATAARSKIWNYFERIDTAHGTARFRFCLKQYSFVGITTSNLKTHIVSKHPELAPFEATRQQVDQLLTDVRSK